MKNDNTAISDSSLPSNDYARVRNDNRIDLNLAAANSKPVNKGKNSRKMNRLISLGIAASIYAPFVISGVAFQNYLVYLIPAIPFLAVAFVYFLLRGISEKAYFKA